MSKIKCDLLKSIDINQLSGWGYLRQSQNGEISWPSGAVIEIASLINQCGKMVVLSYALEGKNHRHPVQVTTTPCNYGGGRHWFVCPLEKSGVVCGKRVAKLYSLDGYFGCRDCHNLTYLSRVNSKGFVLGIPKELFSLETKAQSLQEKIKRPYYRGKPTRKQRALDKLLKRLEVLSGLVIL